MPALQSIPKLLSLEEYENYPENERIEVFDGIVYNMADPSRIHQALLLELSSFLRSYVKGKKAPVKFFLHLLMLQLKFISMKIYILIFRRFRKP